MSKPLPLLLAEALEQTHPHQAAAELRRQHKLIGELVEALEELLFLDEQNTCRHQETKRGGVLWTICCDCGRKWADDEGGMPKWRDPTEWKRARAVLLSAKEQS